MGFLDKIGFGSGGSSQSSYPWAPQAWMLENRLYKPGRIAADQAGQYAQNQLPGLMQPAMGAYNTLGQLSQVGNPFVAQQIGQLGSQLGQFYNEQILPGMNSQYLGAGVAPGSGRWMQDALSAGGALGREFTTGATNLLADSTRQAITAASQMAPMAGGLQGLGMSAYLTPFQALAGILGTGPTVLGSGSSSNPGLFNSILSSFAGGFGQGLGG